MQNNRIRAEKTMFPVADGFLLFFGINTKITMWHGGMFCDTTVRRLEAVGGVIINGEIAVYPFPYPDSKFRSSKPTPVPNPRYKLTPKIIFHVEKIMFHAADGFVERFLID